MDMMLIIKERQNGRTRKIKVYMLNSKTKPRHPYSNDTVRLYYAL